MSDCDARERSSMDAGPAFPARCRQIFVRRMGCGAAEAHQVHPALTVGQLRRHLQNGSGAGRLRLSYNGRPLHDGITVGEALIPDLATLQAYVPLCGGGGDGGATGAESRSSYLEMYKDKVAGKVKRDGILCLSLFLDHASVTVDGRRELDKSEEQLALWTSCRLTMQVLGGDDGKKDVVACQLGYLYNRDAVLECLKRLLVDEIPMPPLAAHITTLKDLTTLKLAPVESAGNGKGDVVDGSEFLLMRTGARFACPLTGLELNGKFRFVCLRPSGVVVAERALKTAPAAVAELLNGQTLESQQQIIIYGTEEEQEALRALDAAAKAKKAKKAEKKLSKAAAAAANGDGRPAESSGQETLKRKAPEGAADGPANGPAANGKPRITGATDAAKEIAVAEAKKYKAGDHVPANADPKLWASLFTSSVVENRKETYGARALSFRR